MSVPASADHELEFLKVCGEEACCWLADVRSAAARAIRHRLAVTLDTLKRYDLGTGGELLAAIEQDIQARAAGHPSVNDYLQRYRLTALAYSHYLAGELEPAKADLLAAYEKIRTLIDRHQFLIPLAIHCTDFIIQRARIARREHQWKEAQRQVWRIRDMYAGLRPFCMLAGGRPIGSSAIRAFYAALPLDAEQREQARRTLGDALPLGERIEALEELVFALPDMVIPYP